MKSLSAFQTMIGAVILAGALSACINSGAKETKSRSLTSAPGASGLPIFVALGTAAASGSTGYPLQISSSDSVEGIIFCVTSTESSINDCGSGKGAFMTAELSATKDGRRFFQANLPYTPIGNQQLTFAAYDSVGARLGIQTVTIMQK